MNKEHWMKIALEQAKEAARQDEVPVGAVLVCENRLISAAGNGPIQHCDPTAHAEILVLREAAKLAQNYRLPYVSLYVTLEPCIMCMGAILHARIENLIYGAEDPKTGAAGSVYQIGRDGLLNHQLQITGGVLQAECSKLLKDFFKQRRKKN